MPAVTLFWLIASWAALALLPVYVFIAGGSPERIACAAFSGGGLGSWLSYNHDGLAFRAFEPALAATDFAVTAIILFLALFALRWWTSCALSLQGIACLAHLLKLLDPGMSASAYALMEQVSTWPTIALVCGGTYLHRRRLKRLGVDPSWSRSLPLVARLTLQRLRLG